MPYTINKFNGQELVVLDDGTIDTSTSLGLVGRNYVGYGETQNENFVFLLENFSNDSPPSRPLKGQTWYDSVRNLLNVFDGLKWVVVGAAIMSATSPESPSAGSLWLKSTTNTLYTYDGTQWVIIGPEAAEGFGVTRARSTTLKDDTGTEHPVILLTVDGVVLGICSKEAFGIDLSNAIVGFSNLVAGITLSSNRSFGGHLTGLADRATRLDVARRINNISFDGQSDITVKASTTNRLLKGDYLVGPNFDGSQEVTWAVDATSANTIGKVVARNSSGGFSAGTINATFVGDITGDVTSAGTSTFSIIRADQVIGPILSGNADSATKLETARKINGVNFDGTQDITVSASALTLTGTEISSTVVRSSLTSVGTLTSLATGNTGITIGSGSELRFNISGSTGVVSGLGKLQLSLRTDGNGVSLMTATNATTLGSLTAAPALVPDTDNTLELGLSVKKWKAVYATDFKGNADTATLSTSSTNIVGGGKGSIPYQTADSATSLLTIGTPGQVLKVDGASKPFWSDLGLGTLFVGSYLTGSNYSGGSDTTWAVDATSDNTAGKVVARDSSGNFSAGTITASIQGNVSGDLTGSVTGAASLNVLKTGDTLSGNINWAATGQGLTWGMNTDGASIKFYNSGDSDTNSRLEFETKDNGNEYFRWTHSPSGGANFEAMRLTASSNGNSTLAVNGDATISKWPSAYWHLTNKAYVDSRLPQYTFISGAQYTYNYTNIVGSWNNDNNFFDVFPPVGKSMTNLVAFIPSIHAIYFAGGVNGDDAMRCSYSYLSDRIRVYVQNTEQRYWPAANYFVIWS